MVNNTTTRIEDKDGQKQIEKPISNKSCYAIRLMSTLFTIEKEDLTANQTIFLSVITTYVMVNLFSKAL